MKVSTLKFTALFACILLFTACQKETPIDDMDFDSSQSISNNESVFNDFDDEAAFRMAETSTTGCPTVSSTAPKGSFPNTITIDFGTDGCVGPNGHVRKGKIIVDVTDKYFTPGSVRTISSVGFSVDDWAIEGQRTVTNLGENNDGNLHWSVVVNNATVTDPDGHQGTWSTSRIRTLIEGAASEGIEDDVYEITGTANGTNRHGKNFSAVVTVPLLKPMSCRWVVSGTIEVNVTPSRGVRTLDFGDGTCDNKGTITFPNGSQREITLRR